MQNRKIGLFFFKSNCLFSNYRDSLVSLLLNLFAFRFSRRNYLVICKFKNDASNTVVCVTEQQYVSIFFTCLWSVRKPLLFRYMGRLVTNQQKCHFSASASFLLAVLVYTHAKLSCIKKQRFVHRPKTSEEYRNVVLFCNADK